MNKVLQHNIQKAAESHSFDQDGIHFFGMSTICEMEKVDEDCFTVTGYSQGIAYGPKIAEDEWKEVEVEAEVILLISVEGDEVVEIEELEVGYQELDFEEVA